MEIKALSLRQPYAELILSGKKTIEIRKWNTKLRGKFMIHAAKKLLEDDCEKFNLNPKKLERGALIGSVELVDVKKYETLAEFNADFDKHLASSEWFKNPCYGFILKNPQRLKETVIYKGQLGFFKVEIN